MKRKVTYRPSKAGTVLGGVVGVIFVFIGLFVVIPQAGLFGLFWTAVAVAITATNFYHAFGSSYIGPDIEISDEEEPLKAAAAAEPAEERLKKLQSLYDQRLITTEEYQEKRKEILKEL